MIIGPISLRNGVSSNPVRLRNGVSLNSVRDIKIIYARFMKALVNLKIF
jgi:hypothetical protein